MHPEVSCLVANDRQWLHSQDLMPILLSFLSAEHSWATQTSAGDFLKAIITISANASQNEQSCIGPNELTRQLVSEACVGKLIKDMLKGGNPLTVGVGIVIEVIRKNNSDYDPDVGAEANTAPSSRDPIYLGTLLRMFATHVPDFMELILSPNHTIGGGDGPVTIRRKELSAAFGNKIEPLGFDRFKTCELMAELLHCSNMGLLNELGSEDFVKARDLERERLKGEGKLKVSVQDGRDSMSEDLNMKSSVTSRLESASSDEMRRLEVQNPSDADGFEEVTHSGVLGDDAKDDFDEKSDMVDDFLTPTKPDTLLSFLDKDDEDFVDEPLSSPRLQADTASFKDADPHDSVLNVMPLSPTKELSHKVGGLHFDEDTTMTSPPPDPVSVGDDKASQSSIAVDKHSLEALEDFVQSHPQSATESVQDPVAPSLHIPLSPGPLEGGLSPHPGDKPAPLFTKKSEISTENIKALNDSVHVSVTTSDCSTTTTIETDDTAMLDAADGSNSVLMGNTEEQSKISPIPAPVVGDFLKMQFVEHKVVPTILVSDRS
jgi:SIT4-associating protein SAP185/190